MGGSKHLIDKIIDNMQNHFREAILKNSGNLEAIRQDVWAVLKHMVRNDTEILEQQHDYCPNNLSPAISVIESQGIIMAMKKDCQLCFMSF